MGWNTVQGRRPPALGVVVCQCRRVPSGGMGTQGETWYRRGLPVLRVITRRVDAEQTVDGNSVPEVAGATGLTVPEVELAVKALLRRGALLDAGDEALVGPGFGILEATAEAYRLVGLHPDPDPEADQRAAVMAALEELSSTLPVDDGKAVGRAAEQLGTLSRDAFAGFIAALAAGGVTG